MPRMSQVVRIPERFGMPGAGRHAGGKAKPVPRGGKLQRMVRRNQLEHNKLLSIGIDLRKLPDKQKKENEQARRRLKQSGRLEKPWKEEKKQREGKIPETEQVEETVKEEKEERDGTQEANIN